MWTKLSVVTLIFFLLTLIQNTFLTHISLLGVAPNVVFTLFFTVVFFQKFDEHYLDIFFAIIVGFFIDIYSISFFGPGIVSLVLVYVVIKTAIYFIKEGMGSYMLLYFLPLFLVCLIFYQACYRIFSNTGAGILALDRLDYISLGYHTILALLVFFAYQYIDRLVSPRQLSLFK